jgi:hypothetical protein
MLKQEGKELSCYKAAPLMGEAGLISHQPGRQAGIVIVRGIKPHS